MKRYNKSVLLFILLLSIILGVKTYTLTNTINPLNLLSKSDNNEKVSNYAQYIIPGGQTIGVELKTKGVLVVGLADIVTNEKVTTSPAKKSGIKIGDKVIAIDNEPVNKTSDIIYYANKNKVKEYLFTIDRNNQEIKIKMTPVESYKTDDIKFGFWARDNIAGIGTMTYINPQTYDFGAIAHGITDTDTGKLIDVDAGIISKAQVTNIKVGKKGEPGEIIGYIMKEGGALGNVEKNTKYGIFGKVNDAKIDFFSKDLIEVGNRNEIHTGPASIYASIDGEVKEYDIEITKLYKQYKPSSKSMVIKITDKQLLNYTNGIIQGMSGCPIIQDNKLVGSVTHVFTNDPNKGYGIYIEWLFDENYNKSSDI